MEVQLPFDTYRHSQGGGAISAQRLINGYAEAEPRSAKTRVAVLGAPCVAFWIVVGDGPIRGVVEMNSLLYVVSGEELWSVDEDGNATFIAVGITGSNPVGMDQNGFEVIIVNGTFVYSYLLSAGTVLQVASAGVHASNSVTVLNSYFILDYKDTNQFYISAVLDGRTYDILDYASAESNSDKVYGVKALNGVLYLLGSRTIEIWSHTGAADFPFAAVNGAVINKGLASTKAFAEQDSQLFILGNDLVAYRVSGQQETRISNSAIEREWQDYDTVSDVFCFPYDWSGSKFVCYTFPTANRTFIFDLQTNLFHERQSFAQTLTDERAWRVTSAIRVFNTVVMGDGQTNKLGKLNNNVFTDFDDTVVMTMVTPTVYNQGKLIPCPMLELDFKAGVGTATGQGSDPVIMMAYSKDGGETFIEREDASMGQVGQYTRRVRWDRLGSAYSWIFRFRVSDPVPRTFTACRIVDDG